MVPLRSGNQTPRQRGQSGQVIPAPLMRTIAPQTTKPNAKIAATVLVSLRPKKRVLVVLDIDEAVSIATSDFSCGRTARHFLVSPKVAACREVASASSAHRLVVDRLHLPAPG